MQVLNRFNPATGRRLLIVAAVIGITAAAALVRLATLTTQPGGLYPDEAAEGITAHRLLYEQGYHPVFTPDDGGRETLFAYFVSFAFRLFGESVTSLRATSAVLGVLGILALGLALRRLGPGVALVAMAWAAGSLWLICISRDGMRNMIVPVFAALAVAALMCWFERPSRLTAALSGIFVAAGLWTYQPLKFLPLLALIWLWFLWRSQRERAAAMLAHVRWAIAAFVIVALPMIFTAVTDPTSYFGRGAATSVLNTGNSNDSFLVHTIRTLGQFTFVGDPNPRHDVNGLPLLGWPLFLLMATGVVVSWQRRRDALHLMLLIGLVLFLIPPLVASEGSSPHFLRNLGLYPFVGGLIGVGAVAIVDVIRRHAGTAMAYATVVVLAAALAGLGASSARAYFDRPVADRYGAYSFDLVDLSRIADGGPGVLVVLDNYSAMDVQFLDSANLPTIVAPGNKIDHVAAYSMIVARSKADISSVAGGDIANRAIVSASSPDGSPTVYTVAP